MNQSYLFHFSELRHPYTNCSPFNLSPYNIHYKVSEQVKAKFTSIFPKSTGSDSGFGFIKFSSISFSKGGDALKGSYLNVGNFTPIC
jgi:hypothetical protein